MVLRWKRLAWWTVAWALACGSGWFFLAPSGYPARLALARTVTGYDGCVCPDCAPVFGMPRPPYGHWCWPRCGGGRVSTAGSRHAMTALGAIGYSVGGLLLLVRRKPPRPGSCACCGYDIRGLSTCPECGQPAAEGGLNG